MNGPSSAAEVSGRRAYAWLALAFAGFVVYGSWLPFTFQPVPLAEAVARYQEALSEPWSPPSRSDWFANVLLMVPVSFCLMGALGCDRPRPGVLGDALLVLPVCLLLSGLVEFGQLFVPGRDCSANDIAAQGVGAVAGAVLWGLLGQRATGWARQLWQAQQPGRWQARLLPAYLGVMLAVYLLPLDLTLSPAAFYHKFKAGQIRLVPFEVRAGEEYAYAEKTALNAVYCAVLGLLFAGLPADRRRARAAFLSALAVVGLLGGVKLLVASRGFDVTDVLVGWLAVAAGWRLGVHLGGRPGSEPLTKAVQLRLRLGLLAGWLALLAFVTWQPFDFDLTLAGPRLQAVTAVPFADLWQGDELLALRGVVQKLVLYLPLGALFTGWRPAASRPAWLPALLGGFLVALVLEAGQLVVASRTASLSDVYLETAGALLGGLMMRRMCASPPEGRPLSEPGQHPSRRREAAGQLQGCFPKGSLWG